MRSHLLLCYGCIIAALGAHFLIGDKTAFWGFAVIAVVFGCADDILKKMDDGKSLTTPESDQ